MLKTVRVISALLIAVSLLLTCGCAQKDGDAQSSDIGVVSSDTEKVIEISDVSVHSAETRSDGAGTAVEQLSLTPLTEAYSFMVKNAVNYKWIAYDNYTLVQHYEEGVNLADGGYLFYIELPETSFDHEMYFEFFAEKQKVKEYSGEVAYTESDKKWYSLPVGSATWQEHTTQKYKLCFSDNGAEFKGYVFIPAESLTYRYESKSLTDIGIYVKTGVQTGNGETGDGLTFKISTVMPVQAFDSSTTLAKSKLGQFDLAK